MLCFNLWRVIDTLKSRKARNIIVGGFGIYRFSKLVDSFFKKIYSPDIDVCLH